MEVKGSKPEKILPLLLIEDVVLPTAFMRLHITTTEGINLMRTIVPDSNKLKSPWSHDIIPSQKLYAGLITQNELDKGEDVKKIGTCAHIMKVTVKGWPNENYIIHVAGYGRFKLVSILQSDPYLMGSVEYISTLSTISPDSDKMKEMKIRFKEAAQDYLNIFDPEGLMMSQGIDALKKMSLGNMSDVFATILKLSDEDLNKVLLATDVLERSEMVIHHIHKTIEDISKIKSNQDSILRGEREVPILKRFEPPNNELDIIENKIGAAKMPKEAEQAARDTLKRLRGVNIHNFEYPMNRAYLDLLVDLPWSITAEETDDIAQARKDLDEDHFGLIKVKKRLLEYLAVRQLSLFMKCPIICLVGPPGVGKTSIAKSISETLSRPFHRIALGGISDQHDIRGHRRTYVGSMPGKIIQGLKTVKVKNPVFLLDEIDKLSGGIQGDPRAALLDVLDPEQNKAFTDSYLNVPFDLSQILFIATANSESGIPPALLDRMEIISVPGYTVEEKLMISQHHLIPKQLKEHGVDEIYLTFLPSGIKKIITEYTREAGVRKLEHNIAAICRDVAVKLAEMIQACENAFTAELDPAIVSDLTKLYDNLHFETTDDFVYDVLGPPIYPATLIGHVCNPGVVVGLVWTPVGGDVTLVEAKSCGGKPSLTLTGQLGSVMKESAKIALSWITHNASKYGYSRYFLTDLGELHIHFPSGAVSKDGPSAGITIITAIVSLLTGVCVKSNVAMTGEITLNGIILPVGGVKEKLLAAYNNGFTTVILPFDNFRDVVDIPSEILDALDIVYVKTAEEVLDIALEKKLTIFKSKL